MWTTFFLVHPNATLLHFWDRRTTNVQKWDKKLNRPWIFCSRRCRCSCSALYGCRFFRATRYRNREEKGAEKSLITINTNIIWVIYVLPVVLIFGRLMFYPAGHTRRRWWLHGPWTRSIVIRSRPHYSCFYNLHHFMYLFGITAFRSVARENRTIKFVNVEPSYVRRAAVFRHQGPRGNLSQWKS